MENSDWNSFRPANKVWFSLLIFAKLVNSVLWVECHFPSSLKYGFHCTDFYETCNGIEWRFRKVNFFQIRKNVGSISSTKFTTVSKLWLTETIFFTQLILAGQLFVKKHLYQNSWKSDCCSGWYILLVGQRVRPKGRRTDVVST